MKRVHVLIQGFVQGVFFRHSVKKLAEELGINGFVRNTSQGVEAVFEGQEDAVAKMVEFCKQGPPSSRVDRIDIKSVKYKGEFSSFRVVY